MSLEDRMEEMGKHLIKTDTIFDMCSHHIDLTGYSEEQDELIEIGMRQVIQSRLYSHGYYSVDIGFFVNVERCDSLEYLSMIITNKDGVIENKIAVRNKIKELKQLNGQMVFTPDKNGILTVAETKTHDEIIRDLEADAI